MNTVAIVGVGLIGGSFGLALRKAGFTGEILGVSSASAIDAALAVKAISGRATLSEAVAVADLIYLAQPVDRILKTIEAIGHTLRPGSLITDAGSTKVAIVNKALQFLEPSSFLGGHPMAGKEQRGVEAANSDLFQGRPYVLTRSQSSESAVETDFRSWLARIGAQVVEITAADHDATVALTSHLPQLISTALAATLSQSSNQRVGEIFGTGLLDMTRLALSSPDLWIGILKSNEDEVTTALDSFIREMVSLRQAFDREHLGKLFENGRTFAARIREMNY